MHDAAPDAPDAAPNAPETPVAPPRLRLEYVDPATLDNNPRNWRRHPTLQKEALEAAMDEVGWAGALLYNERTNRLIDGHARKELSLQKGISCVPVLIGNWPADQEAKILATLDPLAGMAETDPVLLNDLLRGIETGSQALATLITQLAEEAKLIPPESEKPGSDVGDGSSASGSEDAVGNSEGATGKFAFQVVCSTASKRDDLMSSLRAEGYDCAAI